MIEIPEIAIWSWSIGCFLLGYIWVKNKIKK